MKVMAGSWLIASVWTERTRQMSSRTPAVCGRRELSHVPARPACWNGNLGAMTGKLFCPEVMPVSRCPCRMESGSSVPCSSLSRGL